MNKYPKPELFEPTIEDRKRIASKLAKSFSQNKGLRLSDGTIVRGERKSN